MKLSTYCTWLMTTLLIAATYTAADEPCLTPLSDGTVQACGWTGSCPEPGCADKCVPYLMPSNREFGKLVTMSSLSAMQCPLLAGVVHLMSEAANDVQGSRRKLQSMDIQKRVQAAAHWLSRNTASFAVQQRELATIEQSKETLFTRHLSEASDGTDAGSTPGVEATSATSDDTAIEEAVANATPAITAIASGASLDLALTCPTSEDIGSVWSALQIFTSLFEQGLVQAMAGDFGLPEGTDEFATDWYNLIEGVMRTPEDLSGFFESFCATTNVTSDDPLMDLYGTMTSDAGAMLFEIAASPDNDTMAAAQMSSADILAVCRPTDSRDLDVFTAQQQLSAACENSTEAIQGGTCMASNLADLLSRECFEAGAQVLGASAEDRSVLYDAMLDMYNGCSAATESECAGLTFPEEQATVGNVIKTFMDTIMSPPRNPDSQSGTPASPADEVQTVSNHASQKCGLWRTVGTVLGVSVMAFAMTVP